jgi:hypothetical protein
MLNYTHGLIRDAPLSGATQHYQTTIIFYPENPVVVQKITIRLNDFAIVDVLDFLIPEQKFGQLIFQNII